MSGIVVAVTLVVVGFIFLLTARAKKRRMERIQSLAQSRGWEYEPIRERLSTGYRLHSAAWTLEGLTWTADHSPEPSQQSVFQRTRLWTHQFSGPVGLVLVGPWSGSTPDLGGFGRMMVNKLIEKYFGIVDADLHDVPAGSPEFQRKYKILAQNERDATALLSLGMEQRLFNWKGPLPVIKVRENEVRIEVEGNQYKKEGEILAMTDLADAIITTWKKIDN